MNKILLIDKKLNLTSYDEIRNIKKSLPKNTKIGHAGTLDPFATGLLIILIGKTTKLSDYLMEYPKTYEGEFSVGACYDTGDITGNIIKTSDNSFNASYDEYEEIYHDYTYNQVPPRYSAIKINGEKAYNLARQNIEFSNLARPVKIYSFKIKQLDPKTFSFIARVSKGTYIRTLVEDFLATKECLGTTTKLRRVSQGPFNINNSPKELLLNDIIKMLGIKEYKINKDELVKVIHANTIEIKSTEKWLAITNDKKIIALYLNNKTNFKPLFIVGD